MIEFCVACILLGAPVVLGAVVYCVKHFGKVIDGDWEDWS